VRYRALLTGIAAATSAACGTRPIAADDVLGAWRVEAVAAALSPAARASLVFSADGTFKASDLPAELVELSGSVEGIGPLQVRSGSGRWTIERSRGRDAKLSLVFEPQHHNAALEATCAKRCSLWTYVGDPDEGLRLSFVRTGVPPDR
jgi:hypothetical protein